MEVLLGPWDMQVAACGTRGWEEVALAGSRYAMEELACGVVREAVVSLGSCWAERSQQGTRWEDAKGWEPVRGILVGA